MKQSDTCGLGNKHKIKIGVRIMLMNNICIQNRLINERLFIGNLQMV